MSVIMLLKQIKSNDFMKKYIYTLILLVFCQSYTVQAAEVGYYDLTEPRPDASSSGIYAGIGFNNVNIDYNLDDPDNRNSGSNFAEEFNGAGFFAGFSYLSNTKIELNIFRSKAEKEKHLLKIRSADVLIPILERKTKGVFLDLGISHVTSSIKSRDFYQRAFGFNIGLAYELPIYDEFAIRATTKAVIVDKADDLGVDNVYTHSLALLYYF